MHSSHRACFIHRCSALCSFLSHIFPGLDRPGGGSERVVRAAGDAEANARQTSHPGRRVRICQRQAFRRARDRQEDSDGEGAARCYSRFELSALCVVPFTCMDPRGALDLESPRIQPQPTKTRSEKCKALEECSEFRIHVCQ